MRTLWVNLLIVVGFAINLPANGDPTLSDKLGQIDDSVCADRTDDAKNLQEIYRGGKGRPIPEDEQAPSACAQPVLELYDDCARIPSGKVGPVDAPGMTGSTGTLIASFEDIEATTRQKTKTCAEGRKKVDSVCRGIVKNLQDAITENSRAKRADTDEGGKSMPNPVYLETRRKLEAQLKNTRQLQDAAGKSLGDLSTCYSRKNLKAALVLKDLSDRAVTANGGATAMGGGAAATTAGTAEVTAGSSVISIARSGAGWLMGPVGAYMGMISPAGTPCDEAPSKSALEANAKGCSAYTNSALSALHPSP